MHQIDCIVVCIDLESVEVVVVDAGYDLRGFGVDRDGYQNCLLTLVKVEFDRRGAGAEAPVFGGDPGVLPDCYIGSGCVLTHND